MPTPPKESIGGNKSHQFAALDFAKKQYDYLVELETFLTTQDFADLSEIEQFLINKEIDEQNISYETLRGRLEEY